MFFIAKNYFASDKLVVEDSYVCGLLHDMGKLIFDVAHPKVIEEFERSLQDKAISSIVLEKITAGQNHAEIGGLIAKKWNFPKEVSLTIQYHHYPETAPTEVKKLSTVVYFANMLANYQEHIVEYYQFNQSVLSVFGIENENQLKAISDKLNKVFTN